MTAADKYKAFKKTYEEARKALSEQAGQAFKEMAKELFEKFPKLHSFQWNQYTPYFADGDPCVFSVNSDEDQISVNGMVGYDCESLSYDGKSTYNTGELPEGFETREAAEEAYSAVANFIRQFDDEILLDLYGDHCEVTVNRDGKAVVESYDHD